jgi:hypothetical protein
MTRHAWKFVYGTIPTTFTSDVLSFSGDWGRQNYLDNYSGGGFSVTIKNNTNQAASFIRGTDVQIQFSDGQLAWIGKVTTVDYNDYAGDTGLSTATIRCIDSISQAGKFTLQNFNYTAAQTCDQAMQTNSVFPTSPQISASRAGDSAASGTASAYNGTILNRLNVLNNTEKGLLVSAYAGGTFLVTFKARSQVNIFVTTVQLKRTGDNTTTISYRDIRRIGLGDNFMNQVDVKPETVASQLVNNTASQTAYGISGYTVDTVDSTTTQAAGLSSWLATMQGEPSTLRFEVDFDDVSCNATAFNTFMYDILLSQISNVTMQYQAQGQSLQTVPCVVEGMSFSGTPSQTDVTVYLSPATYYQYFILNSTTFGILNTSRLGW